MYPAVVHHLRCPVCRAELTAAPDTDAVPDAAVSPDAAATPEAAAPQAQAASGAALRCPAGHSFDVARQGDVDLTGGHLTHAGDTAEMVAARAALLGAGHYRPLADAIVAVAGRYAPPGLVVDIGAGTGYYLHALLAARPTDPGLALDVSKAALRRAGAAHPRLAAVRADAWRRLPVADGTASLLLDAFAPRSGAEFRRILRPDGALVVVTPTDDHLRELVEAAGLLTVDRAKQERLAAALRRWFIMIHAEYVSWPLRLSQEEARALVAMGPSAHHADPVGTAGALAALGSPVAVGASVRLTIWRPRPEPEEHRGL